MISKLKQKSQKGFTLIELMIVVAIIGILAAVAIPAFMKYIKKSKTSEAGQMLKKMSNGAREYYQDPRVVGAVNNLNPGNIAKQFPATIALDADPGCCAIAGAGGAEKCNPQLGGWAEGNANELPWKALDFAMSDPHYYAYGFDNGGLDRYTVRAQGNLDCDGEFSTYTLFGQVVDGEVNTSGTPQKVQPLE